jgi:hypothetical protein
VQDVLNWLTSMGLKKYVPAFRARDVTGQMLLRLTNDDLVNLSVKDAHDRQQIIDGITDLKNRIQVRCPHYSICLASCFKVSLCHSAFLCPHFTYSCSVLRPSVALCFERRRLPSKKSTVRSKLSMLRQAAKSRTSLLLSSRSVDRRPQCQLTVLPESWLSQRTPSYRRMLVPHKMQADTHPSRG